MSTKTFGASIDSRLPPVAEGTRITFSKLLRRTSISCGRKVFSAATAYGYEPVNNRSVVRGSGTMPLHGFPQPHEQTHLVDT